MQTHAPTLQVVEDSDLPEYPISASERLDSHFFVLWNVKRWMASDFRRAAYQDPEVGFYGIELFFLSQGETPVGTLPCDDEALAFLLRIRTGVWAELKGRAVGPLNGWSQVMCDNGEIRLAHPVVTDVAIEAMKGKKRNAAKNADDRMRKRLATIREHLVKGLPGMGSTAALAKNEELLNAISDWIDQTYEGGSATMKRVKEAVIDLHSDR